MIESERDSWEIVVLRYSVDRREYEYILSGGWSNATAISQRVASC